MRSIRGIRFSVLLIILLAVGCLESHPTTYTYDNADFAEIASQKFQNDYACNKEGRLWNDFILPGQYGSLPDLEDVSIIDLIRAKMHTKMFYDYDIAPKGWKKPIHKHGVVVPVKFVPVEGTNLKGIFAGAECGFMRLSLTYTPEKRGVAPGVALKFFRDFTSSANASFLPSLDSQGDDYNFFAHEFKHQVPPSKKLGARLVALIFSKVSSTPNLISIRHWSDGKGPHAISLRPTQWVQFPSSPARDLRHDFLRIKKGTIVFDVYSLDSTPAMKIGHIQTKGPAVASEFGDLKLFFRHERLND